MTQQQDHSQSLLTKTVLIVALVFMIVHFLIYAADLLIPLVVALLIWFLINALANSYLKIPLIGRFVPRGLAMILSIVTIFIFGYLSISLIVAEVSDMSAIGQKLQQGVRTLINQTAEKYGLVSKDVVNKIVSWIGIEQQIKRIASSLASLTSQLGTILLYVAFLLADQKFFPAKIEALVLTDQGRRQVRSILVPIAQGIQDYLSVMTLASSLTAGLSYGVMLWLGLENAIFWAFIIFILNFIPSIGSMISTLLTVLFAYLQFENYIQPTFLLVAIGTIQTVIGNILVPWLAGNKLNLSQFVIILALFAWSAIWGIVGMFLAVPITSMLMISFSKFEKTQPWAILLSQKGQIDNKPIKRPA